MPLPVTSARCGRISGLWIEDFGIQFEVTAVVSDAEFAAMWPMVEAAASVS